MRQRRDPVTRQRNKVRGATAIVLFGVLGFRWPLLAALVTEAVPGLQLFPAWTLVVLALAATEAERSERGY